MPIPPSSAGCLLEHDTLDPNHSLQYGNIIPGSLLPRKIPHNIVTAVCSQALAFRLILIEPFDRCGQSSRVLWKHTETSLGCLYDFLRLSLHSHDNWPAARHELQHLRRDHSLEDFGIAQYDQANFRAHN